MNARYLLAVAACVLVWPGLTTDTSAAPRPTPAEIRRAAEIQRRLVDLVREETTLTSQLAALTDEVTRASGLARETLVDRRTTVTNRLAVIDAEQASLGIELEALPEAARRAPQGQTPGALTPADPTGLRPLNLTPNNGQISDPKAFNPMISVIPDFKYFRDSRKGATAELIEEADGFHGAHGEEGHEHEGLAEGFNLGETELAFSASVDPYFDANALLAVSEEGIEAEEVYIQTRALPGGLQVRAGKFLSGIGYVNRQHPHQWDFADQNLAYELMLGHHGMNDKGVQVTWLPAWPFYAQFGFEALQGSNEKLANYVGPEEFPGLTDDADPRIPAHKPGPRLFTGFLRVSPNLGYSNALQVGVSTAVSRAHQEIHDHDGDGVPEGVLDGTAMLYGADLVFKHDAPHAYGRGDLTVQAEYLYRKRDLDILGTTSTAVFKNDGVYAQVVYGFASRWTLAGRASFAGLTNERNRAGVLTTYETSSQYSAALAFSPTEFSRIRAQYNRNQTWVEGVKESANVFFVQLQVSMGAHGAHKF